MASVGVRLASLCGGPPSEFDEFELLHTVGSGGMGTVYAARDRRLDRLVAIKFAATDGRDPHARARFAREARALARLQHPNVVSLFRFGEADGRPYIACELIAGSRLDELPLPLAWPAAVRVGVGLARALAATHQRGVIHRDIKPSNVMVATDGLVKLLDFGLAAFAPPDDGAVAAPPIPTGASASSCGRITEVGRMVGTPRYMAPELWCGGAATPSSDLYAFGLVLRDLLVGRPPTDVVTAIAHLPRPLVRLVGDCVRREPTQRPTSAAYVRDELERLAGGELAPVVATADEPPTAMLRELIGSLSTYDSATADGVRGASVHSVARAPTPGSERPPQALAK